MKKIMVFLTALAFIVFISALPCLAKEKSEKIEEPKDITLTANDLPVDETIDENEPEPSMPEVKAVPSYFGIVNIWVAYTTLSMTKVNDEFANETANLALAYTTSVSKISSGYVLGLDLGFKFIKDFDLSVGPRIEYIGCGQGSIKATNGILGAIFTPDITIALNTTLIPLLVGASYEYEMSGVPLAFTANAYVGYAIAKGSLEYTSTVNEKTGLSGGGFAADLNVTANYQINDPLSAGLTIGYRMASLSQMTCDTDTVHLHTVNGQSLKDMGSQTIPFDFSGINIGINVDMKY